MDDIDSAANRRYEGDGADERRRSIEFGVGVCVDI
jgi:hypothetical protein